MARSLKFHLDENMGHAIAKSLTRRGMDVTTTSATGLIQANDPRQLLYCSQNQRVLLTCDFDFVQLHNRGISHSGIVIFKDEDRQLIGPVVRFVELMWEIMETDEMSQQLIYA
ncbi:MAG: DUF5615 family PIN-like protein [Gemmatales bacterium]